MCARMRDGTVRCWGYNISGMLADGTTTERRTPVDAAALSGATQLVAGDFHVCAIVPGTGVRCWGSNDRGQLGFATTLTYQPYPGTVPGV